MKEKFDVHTFAGKGSNIEVVSKTQIVVLAIKPIYLLRVLEEIRDHLTEDHLVVSIVAGASLESIGEELKGHKRIARLCVNTPSLVGAGAIAYCLSESTKPEDS